MSRHVTRASIVAGLKKWHAIFHLGDWQLCIEWEKEQPEDKPDLSMRISWPADYRSVTVKVFPHTFTLDPLMVDQTCCHEMTHLIFAPVDDELARLIGGDSEVWECYSRHKETAIDRLAVALNSETEAK